MDRCQVCFAGSVIANRSGFSPYDHAHIGDTKDVTLHRKLWFCSDVATGESRFNRQGANWEWTVYKGGDDGHTLHWSNIGYVSYKTDPEQWMRYMRGVIKQFKERGL